MISKPWWQTDHFSIEYPMPPELLHDMGPNGIPLVQVWHDGRTQPGWGLNPPPGSEEGFMPRYLRGEFNPRRALYHYSKSGNPFAFVMRGIRAVCIDVDGKNGGMDELKKLGLLPPTLAETSKSGNGLHLFYFTTEEWDETTGFAAFADHIGIQQGIDFRGTGCVYHYPTQRWNGRPLVELPEFVADMLRAKENRRAESAGRIAAVLSSNDELEIMLMRDQLISELNKPIPDGKRNNTLFAIASQMREAEISDWPQLINERAEALGLDADEIDKLIHNVERYAPAAP